MKTKISIIGSGFVGGSIAQDFKKRGHTVVQYSLEKPFINNKELIKYTNFCFVCVPTPTTYDKGFDDSILIKAIKECTIDGQVIIIKSTITVGTTDKLQKMFPRRFFIHCPEFLTEATRFHDASNPARNIVGYTKKSKKYAQDVMYLLPKAEFETIIPCKEAELVKYAANCSYYVKGLIMNIFYDIAKKEKLNYNLIKQCITADPMTAPYHISPIHKGGRGMGNHCLLKDFETLKKMYAKKLKCNEGYTFLLWAINYNKYLLKSTKKDLNILEGIYGKQ